MTLRPPLEAHDADHPASATRIAPSPAEPAWITVAQATWRLAQLRPEARAAYARQSASVIRGALAAMTGSGATTRDDAGRPPIDVDALRARAAASDVADALAGWGEPDAAERLAESTRRLAEWEEMAGAFHLAYTTIGSLRLALHDSGTRIAAMLLARQGRIARQLGDLATAADHYALAESLARSAGEVRLRLEARLGLGVLANMRGNYPEARATFGSVLRAAARHRLADLEGAAHQGLLAGALAAGDAAAALHHGWAALRGATEEPDRWPKLLANLGEACLLAGEYDAALRAFAAAASRSTVSRIRLPALGGAAIAAARSARGAALERVRVEAEKEMERSGQPHENAFTLVELAEAYRFAGDAERAERYRARAAELARAGGYHEIEHRAEALRALPVATLAAADRDVVHALEALELTRGAALLVG